MANFRKGEAGETAESSNQELRDLLMCIEHRDRSQRAKIPKVPPMLRNVESDKICYDPQVVSIGPYHHGNLGLEEGEQLKFEMANQFFERIGRVDELYRRVLQVSKEARAYYVECQDTRRFDDNNEFALIMFLDVCSLLQYMHHIVSEHPERLHMMSSHSIALVARDLLMVENQLPSIIIDALLDYDTRGPAEKSLRVYNFVLEMYRNRLNHKFKRNAHVLPKEFKRHHFHLLDLFCREMFLGPRKYAKQDGEFDGYGQLEAASFCSVKELWSIEIRLKVDPDFFPSNIHFQSHLIFAHPRIIVDGSTKGILLNMIAYEMCKEDDPRDSGVTDFVCFMDSLIDHADDTKLLRSSGILYNGLGNDEQAADLFNHIVDNLIPSPNAYRTVKRSIQTWYEKERNVRFGELWHNYFRSPWALMALCAVVILLLLTIIQTIVNAIQTHYTIHPQGN